MSEENRIRVEQAVTVKDAEGKDAYELKAAGGAVRIEQKQLSFTSPWVRLEDLREALNALHAMD